MKIDLTMTTALRPEVLYATLWSIRENLIWDGGFNLIINLALVGGIGKHTEGHIRDIAEQYFPEYTMRVRKVSSSTDGLQWTWRQTQSKYVLQWEDDWILKKKVDLSTIINFMKKNIDVVFLDREGKSVLDVYPEGSFKQIQPGFLRRDTKQTLIGSPALYQKQSIDQVVNLISPLSQLGVNSAHSSIQSVIRRWSVYAFIGTGGSLVQDIGRLWMKKNRFVRGENEGGRTWVCPDNELCQA